MGLGTAHVPKFPAFLSYRRNDNRWTKQNMTRTCGRR